MGSSSKAPSTSKKRQLSDHALTLRRRLHEALALGIRSYDKKGRKWECMDAEVQSHALRAMTAFIGCTSSALSQHPLVKDSVSDMLVALAGILQSENKKILNLAVNVTVELVSCLGTSLRHFHVLEVIISLSRLLSLCQLPLVISCAIALNGIITKFGNMRHEKQKEIWEAMEKNNIVSSVVCALLDYTDGTQSPEYFTEMASLLKTILWRWPPSRYRVWSNSKFMVKLGEYFLSPDTSIAIGILQLLAALALCGDGAVMILESKELLSKVLIDGMGTLQPYNVRYEALILCKHLTRSAKACSMLTSLYCEPIVQGIISALGGWRSCSGKISTDQTPLLMEACHTASMTRWAGNHHYYFWNLEIDTVLLDILLGNCSKIYRKQAAMSSEELITKIYNNNTNARPHIWDILGWLAMHCEEDFLPKTEGRQWCLDNLILCACSVAKDLLHNRRSSISVYTSEIEPVCRAVLLMVFSPCKYISSQARYQWEMARNDGGGYLEYLLTSLKLKAIGNVSLVSDYLQTATNLIVLACYASVPQYQKLIVENQGIQMLSAIIKRCLNIDIHISRSSLASHLRSTTDGRICCWNHVEDWDGADIHLLYSLQALSQLILFSGVVCDLHNVTSRDIIVCKVCNNSEARDMVDNLQYIMSNSFSPGVKWYAAYILSFFDSYGFPSKLGERMKRALDENDVADLKLILANGKTLTVHGAILVARCPYLLPPEELLKVRMQDNESTKEQEIEQNGKKYGREVRMSDRVNYQALIKILEYVYTGTFQTEDDLLKPLKILAKCCGLKLLSDMLYRKLPAWGTPTPSCDFTGALGPTGYSFSDIVLEAKATEGVALNCNVCQLSMPHMHAHKIILWSSCDYLRALFQSGMYDSFSQIIKIPVGWLALIKLVDWFYLGKLPRINLSCIWNNMEAEQQLHEMRAYVELSSLAEYWFLDEVGDDSLNVVVSCMKSNQKLSIEIIQCAVELGQWKIVKAAVCNIAPLYPKMRGAGDLENLDEEVVEMLRAEYVRYSQECNDLSD